MEITLTQVLLIWLIPMSVELCIAGVLVWTARDKPQNPIA